MSQDANRQIAVLDTDEGTIVLGFFPDVAPNHVENFISLSQDGYYDGTKFHRIVKGFMIQGGDGNSKSGPPSTWGTGNPGYTVDAEFNDRPHVRGTLSMARSNNPNSAGSQFFICQEPAPHLDGQYTVFGETLIGMDVVDKIANAPLEPGTRDRPAHPITLNRVTITTVGEYRDS